MEIQPADEEDDHADGGDNDGEGDDVEEHRGAAEYSDVEGKDADAEMADAKERDEVEEDRGAAEHSDVEEKDADAEMADATRHSEDEDMDFGCRGSRVCRALRW